MKAKHNIYLSDEGKDNNKIVIKGNGLDCRWFGKSILIWSNDNEEGVDDVLLSIERRLKLLENKK